MCIAQKCSFDVTVDLRVMSTDGLMLVHVAERHNKNRLVADVSERLRLLYAAREIVTIIILLRFSFM